MRHPLLTLTVFILLGATFGWASGALGTYITHWNHNRGVGYSKFKYDWVAIPSLPGSIIAESQAGYDWRWDEEWLFRDQVMTWNTLIWTIVSAIVGILWVILREAKL